MKSKKILPALALAFLASSASGQLIFTSNGSMLESIEFTEDLSFTVTNSVSGDSGFLLVINDAYITDTYLEDENWYPQGPLTQGAKAVVNGTFESNFSMPWLLRESFDLYDLPLTNGLDAKDLLFIFHYDWPNFSVNSGDTITILSGLTASLPGLYIPVPDNLSANMSVHLVPQSFMQSLSDVKSVAVAVPEVSTAVATGIASLPLIVYIFWKRRKRSTPAGE